jgi:hypothetical protein
VQLQEALLQQILGQRALAGQADQIGQDPRGHQLVQAVEGARVAVAVPPHQLGLLFEVRGGSHGLGCRRAGHRLASLLCRGQH